jgi:hypothetical protein
VLLNPLGGITRTRELGAQLASLEGPDWNAKTQGYNYGYSH